jgi:hypothetical protein
MRNEKKKERKKKFACRALNFVSLTPEERVETGFIYSKNKIISQ